VHKKDELLRRLAAPAHGGPVLHMVQACEVMVS
jgi:hypothetical protein